MHSTSAAPQPGADTVKSCNSRAAAVRGAPLENPSVGWVAVDDSQSAHDAWRIKLEIMHAMKLLSIDYPCIATIERGTCDSISL